MNLTDRQRRSLIELGLRHVCGEHPDSLRVSTLFAQTKTLPSAAQLIDAVVTANAVEQNVIDIRRAALRKKMEFLFQSMLAVHHGLSMQELREDA